MPQTWGEQISKQNTIFFILQPIVKAAKKIKDDQSAEIDVKVKLNEFLTKIDFPMAEIFDVVYPKFCKFVNVILPMIDDDLRDFFLHQNERTPCCM